MGALADVYCHFLSLISLPAFLRCLLFIKSNFQLQYERAWEHNPGGVVHLVNLLFQLPFVQWFEFIDVGFTPLCKMCTNLGKEGQMAVASVWAQLEPKWLQDRVGMIQQVIVN